MNRKIKYMRSIVLVAGVLLLSLSFLNAETAAKATDPEEASAKGVDSLKVIAYYGGGENEIDNYAVEELDQIIYSFLHLMGNKLWVKSEAQDAALRKLVSLKKDHPNLEILISLGGWGGCETCSEVFSKQKNRTAFAKSVLKILKIYGADGIDLDWEYPAIEGHPGHGHKAADKRNFTLLIKTLREVLGTDYQLSFAAGAHLEFLNNSIEWDSVMPLVDNVNIMTYDLVNGYSKTTGHHAGLYSSSEQAIASDYTISYLDSMGVPLNKMVIGAAFYARIWSGVDSLNNGLYQKGVFQTSILYKDFASYFDDQWEMHWDSTANAPYAYNASQKLFATFDDVTSVANKTNYAQTKGLKGIMFWELTQDVPKGKKGSLLHAIAQQILLHKNEIKIQQKE